MAKKNKKNCPGLRLTLLILVLMLFLALPAGAGINFNYNSTTHRNYTITDEVFNSLPPNFIRFIDGNIELPTLRLEFALNKTITSGNRTLILKSNHFGPRTTFLPNQKVFYTGPGGTALVSYNVNASSWYFANETVNISTFKQGSNNVPFFSDLSFAVLNFNDLKNTWNNDTKVLDEFMSALDDTNKINETSITLNPSGDYGPVTQNLVPGNYLVMVTRGDDPREIITFNNIQVVPFDSSILIGDGTGAAIAGSDVSVNIALNPAAPTESYTYITNIINKYDYLNDLGDINITWGPEKTLAQATRVNSIVLNDTNGLSDIIPYSNTTRVTSSSKSANLVLKTAGFPAGNYFIHTLVSNSTNLSVAFNQSTLTLTAPPPPDTTPPLLIVNQPINISTFATDTITVAGSATDANGISSVKVNGSAVPVDPAGSFSTTVILSNGSNTITVTATDGSPNANNITVTRTVTYDPLLSDNTPPLLIVNQPINGSTFANNTITVAGSATDANGISSVEVNGSAVPVDPVGSFSTTVILSAGSNTITVTATDGSTNANNITVTRTVTYNPTLADNTPPLLIVSQPINGSTFATDTIIVSGSVTDANGISSVKVNGNVVPVNPAGSFSTTVILSAGSNTITVTATDGSTNANNITVTRTVNYNPSLADFTSPILIVNKPLNGSTFATDTITVAGSATDANGISSVKVNGDAVSVDPAGSFSTTVILLSGSNTITVTATDRSPNANNVTVTRTVTYNPSLSDTTPPSLSVYQPTNGQVFNTSLITVSGTASDSSGIYSISVNDAIISESSGAFSTNVYLTTGTNIIQITATDASSNKNNVTVKRTVIYTPVVEDKIKPSLVVNKPADGQVFTISSITVSGTVYDKSGIYSVTVNDDNVLVDATGSFSTTVILAEGSNTINVTATDASNNKNSESIVRTVTYTPVAADTTPPSLVVNKPADGQVFTTSPIMVTGRATDLSGISFVTVNGIPVSLTTDGYFGTQVDLSMGSNTISIQAVDSSSNLNSITTTLTVTRTTPPDNEPPKLRVIFPTEGLSIESPSNTTDVYGTVSDNTGVDSVTVNGIPATLAGESFNASIILVEGGNLITVIATDNSTNHNSKTITRNMTYTKSAAAGSASNITLYSNPPALDANGKDTAKIVAHVTDASGIEVADGTNVTFTTSAGKLYSNKTEIDILPGSTTLSALTKNGMATVVLVSSTTPGTANVTAQTDGVSASVDVAFRITSRPKSKFDDITLTITHSPSIEAENSSIELDGSVGTIRTSTEIAVGIVTGTRISYNIGDTTVEGIISNPIIMGDLVIFNVDSIMLNNTPITSSFNGIGNVSSDVDIGINTLSQLNGMVFVMSLHQDIADDQTARGGADAGLAGADIILADLGSSLGITDVNSRIAFVTSADLSGATSQDILDVPISMTVSGDWYRNIAGSKPENVHLAEIHSNGTIGLIQTPESYTYDSANDSYTFVFSMNGFSTFALVGTPAPTAASPPQGSGTGAGGGGVITDEPFDNIAKAERHDKALIAGKPVIYTFTDPEHGIYEVAVTGKANEDDVTLRIEALKGTSKLVAVPAFGVVYKNLNILIGTRNIKEALVRFRVENSWLSSNDLAGDNIKLLKWDGSKWIQLDTAELRKDASYTYFESRTDTFSHFAISGVKAQDVPTVTTTQPSVTSAATVTPTATAGAGAEGPQVNLFLIIGVIVLIAIVVVFYLKRK